VISTLPQYTLESSIANNFGVGFEHGPQTTTIFTQIVAEFGSPQTGPNGEPQQALLPGCSGFAQACHKLGPGSDQAKVRFAHIQVRLRQQLLRSKDGNGSSSCRDSDVEHLVIVSQGNRKIAFLPRSKAGHL
jgi:hypothetical protein